jgi:hypothetical protein
LEAGNLASMSKRKKIDAGLTRLDLVPDLTEKIWQKTKSYAGKKWSLPKKHKPLLVQMIGEDLVNELYAIEDTAAQNIHLRKVLEKPLRDKDYVARLAAIKWVIYSWGGITRQGNDDEKWPEQFGNYEPEVITEFVKAQNNKRIASWSKVFAFVDSKKYAIYDARVAISLNSILDELGDSNRFFMPSTKIEDLPDLFDDMRKQVAERYKGKTSKYLGYFEYMFLLHAMVEKKLAQNVLDAEMRLFANFDIHANRFASKHGLALPYPDVPYA